MNETKQQLTARKIRNGVRKQYAQQAAEVERIRLEERDKIWAILNQNPEELDSESRVVSTTNSGGRYYATYIPILPLASQVIITESTA